jgi:amidohydrolase
MTDLLQLRKNLHRLAEPSGEESRTAHFVAEELRRLRIDVLETGVGGHGILASISASEPGPTVLLRADLDALPLSDDASLEHASERNGCSHRCGHDGHMAMAIGVARALQSEPPKRGRVVLLFQPAEETGQGAWQVLQDERFQGFTPDFVLATHNLPGYPLGSVVLREGVFASASRGMCVEFIGRASHASEPAAGRNPIHAAASLSQELHGLPQAVTALEECAQVTIVGLVAGGANYGINPGEARLMATLRAHSEAAMRALVERAEELAQGLAQAHGLKLAITWHDEFPATPCDAQVVDRLKQVASGLGVPVIEPAHPFPWSEDFGHFTSRYPGALFGLGSGESQPRLHTEGYDFPDDLLEPGVRFLTASVRTLLEVS